MPLIEAMIYYNIVKVTLYVYSCFLLFQLTTYFETEMGVRYFSDLTIKAVEE